MPMYKAWYKRESVSAVSGLAFSFRQIPTSIEAVESEAETGNGSCYDLSGRKVSTPSKGIYIKDGKKIYVK